MGRLDLLSAILLAAATVATAYSAYESTRWGGVQSTEFVEAGGARVESAKARSDGNALLSIDASLFSQYALAFSEGNEPLQRILEERFFRPELQRAFDAWLEQDPSNNPDAARNPFELAEYRVAAIERADRLEEQASQHFDRGREANQSSDDYVLATIFFAAVLFFAGVGVKFSSVPISAAMLGFAALLFAVGLVRLTTLPFH